MKANLSIGRGFGGALNYVEQKQDSEFVCSNMNSDNAKELAREFGEAKDMYHGRGEKPVFHASLSPSPNDTKFDDEKIQEMAEDYLRKMGMDPEKHQYALYRHKDTEHEHFHLVANRISNDGQQFWNDSFSHRRSIQSTQELEKEHGLVRTPGLEGGKKSGQALTKGEREHAGRLGVEHPKDSLRRGIDQALEGCDGTRKGFNEKLDESGITAHWSISKRNGFIRGASYELQDGPEGIANKFQGGQAGQGVYMATDQRTAPEQISTKRTRVRKQKRF